MITCLGLPIANVGLDLVGVYEQWAHEPVLTRFGF